MGFLASIVIKLLQWIMICGGEALFNYAKKKIKEHDDEKTAHENTKKHDAALDSGNMEEIEKTGRDLLNRKK